MCVSKNASLNITGTSAHFMRKDAEILLLREILKFLSNIFKVVAGRLIRIVDFKILAPQVI